jgi:hypothetical protein
MNQEVNNLAYPNLKRVTNFIPGDSSLKIKKEAQQVIRKKAIASFTEFTKREVVNNDHYK